MTQTKDNMLQSRVQAEALAIRTEASSEMELIQRADELLTRAKETIKAFSNTGKELLSLMDLSPENQAKKLKQMEAALFLRAQTINLAADIHDFFNTNKAELRKAYGHDKNNGKFLIILRFLGEKLPKLFKEQQAAEGLLDNSMRTFAASNPGQEHLIGVDFDVVNGVESNSSALDAIRRIEAPRTLMTLAVMIVFLLLSTSRVSASKETALDNELIDFSDEETRDAIAAALSLFGQTVANIEDLGTTTDFITTMENYIADVANGNVNFNLESDLFSGGGGRIETGDGEEDPTAEEISVVPQYDNRNSWQLTINANEGLVILSNEMITELLSETGISGEEVLITYNEDTQEIEFRLRVEDGNEIDGTNYDADQAPVAIIAAADLQELMPENSRLFMVNESNIEDLQEIVSINEGETETQPEMIVTPINNGTNVRITTSTGNTEVVGQVDSDTQLVVLDIVEDGQAVSGNPVWYQISWTDDEGIEQTGYIADQVVNVQEQPELDAEAAPTPDVEEAATEPASEEEVAPTEAPEDEDDEGTEENDNTEVLQNPEIPAQIVFEGGRGGIFSDIENGEQTLAINPDGIIYFNDQQLPLGVIDRTHPFWNSLEGTQGLDQFLGIYDDAGINYMLVSAYFIRAENREGGTSSASIALPDQSGNFYQVSVIDSRVRVAVLEADGNLAYEGGNVQPETAYLNNGSITGANNENVDPGDQVVLLIPLDPNNQRAQILLNQTGGRSASEIISAPDSTHDNIIIGDGWLVSEEADTQIIMGDN